MSTSTDTSSFLPDSPDLPKVLAFSSVAFKPLLYGTAGGIYSYFNLDFRKRFQDDWSGEAQAAELYRLLADYVVLDDQAGDRLPRAEDGVNEHKPIDNVCWLFTRLVLRPDTRQRVDEIFRRNDAHFLALDICLKYINEPYGVNDRDIDWHQRCDSQLSDYSSANWYKHLLALDPKQLSLDQKTQTLISFHTFFTNPRKLVWKLLSMSRGDIKPFRYDLGVLSKLRQIILRDEMVLRAKINPEIKEWAEKALSPALPEILYEPLVKSCHQYLFDINVNQLYRRWYEDGILAIVIAYVDKKFDFPPEQDDPYELCGTFTHDQILRALEYNDPPKKDQFYTTLGMILMANGKMYDECWKAFQEAFRINPYNHIAMFYMGYALAEFMNRPNEGIHWLFKAIDLVQKEVGIKLPHKAFSLYLEVASSICERLNRKDNSLRFARISMESDPGDHMALWKYLVLLSDQHFMDEFERMTNVIPGPLGKFYECQEFSESSQANQALHMLYTSQVYGSLSVDGRMKFLQAAWNTGQSDVYIERNLELIHAPKWTGTGGGHNVDVAARIDLARFKFYMLGQEKKAKDLVARLFDQLPVEIKYYSDRSEQRGRLTDLHVQMLLRSASLQRDSSESLVDELNTIFQQAFPFPKDQHLDKYHLPLITAMIHSTYEEGSLLHKAAQEAIFEILKKAEEVIHSTDRLPPKPMEFRKILFALFLAFMAIDRKSDAITALCLSDQPDFIVEGDPDSADTFSCATCSFLYDTCTPERRTALAKGYHISTESYGFASHTSPSAFRLCDDCWVKFEKDEFSHKICEGMKMDGFVYREPGVITKSPKDGYALINGTDLDVSEWFSSVKKEFGVEAWKAEGKE